MTACSFTDRSKIPCPVMTKVDTGTMDQADVARHAIACARNYNSEPVLLSWFSRREGTCGPENICHEDGSFWLDYALGRGADLSVVVNDWDYVFIFKKV